MDLVKLEERDGFFGLARRVRLVLLLDAAEKAGLVPLPLNTLHALAYFSNVLAPVWELTALDGKVLKQRGGPFYPALQTDLDCLVGAGVALISELGHALNEDGHWRILGSYRLNHQFAERVLSAVADYGEESRLLVFIQELAYALSSLSDHELGRSTAADATYSDPGIDRDNVVDFAEWSIVNYSANAANTFATLVPGASRAAVGELVNLYVQHMRSMISGGY